MSSYVVGHLKINFRFVLTQAKSGNRNTEHSNHMKFPLQKRKQKSKRQKKTQIKHINGLWLNLFNIYHEIYRDLAEHT